MVHILCSEIRSEPPSASSIALVNTNRNLGVVLLLVQPPVRILGLRQLKDLVVQLGLDLLLVDEANKLLVLRLAARNNTTDNASG